MDSETRNGLRATLPPNSPTAPSRDRRRLLGAVGAASLATAAIGVVGLADRAGAQTRLLTATGKVIFLRMHEVGSGYGPSGDHLDAEVTFKLDTAPDNAFGFQLRNDSDAATHRGMLDLLRDAFNNWTVTADYDVESGNRNGLAIRVALTKA